MIQQLILSTLFSCANKNSEVSKDVVPPTPPESIIPETQKNNSLLDEEEATLSLSSDVVGLHPTSPLQVSQEYKGAILVEHIQKIQESNQEISCTLLCQQSLLTSPFTQGSYIINTCSEKREENWQELVQQDDPKTSLGEVSCTINPKGRPRIIKGRAPMSITSGFVPAEDLATHFARQAQEEALSVFSFAELYENLRVHGAPTPLLERCIQALKEEQTHTRIALSLCKQYGGTVPHIKVPKPTSPTLFTAALHNALVGCIQETWAALLETYQAEHTSTHQRLQQRIAIDEASHAQLAWDIHLFFMELLSPKERSCIIDAMTTLLTSQNIEWVSPFPSSQNIGLPSKDTQKNLYVEFSGQLQQIIRQAA